MTSTLIGMSIVSVTLLCAMGVNFVRIRSRPAILTGLLFFLLSAYLLIFAIPPDSPLIAINPALAKLSNLIPACIWFLSFYLFRDRDKVPWYIYLSFFSYFLLRASGIALNDLGVIEADRTFYLTYIVLPQLLMIGLSVHAVYMAISGYSADLIELRRNLRVIFIVLISMLILLTRFHAWIVYSDLYVYGTSHSDSPRNIWLFLVNGYSLLFATLVYFYCFSIRPNLNLFLITNTLGHSITDLGKKRVFKSDEKLVSKIKSIIEIQKIYREPGLTIDIFSQKLGVNKNKLRNAITRYFGAKNFNQFLNSYRLEDVQAKLMNSDEPISVIAYDSGFASISVFNTTFKAKFGVCPRTYRLTHGTQSDTANLAKTN